MKLSVIYQIIYFEKVIILKKSCFTRNLPFSLYNYIVHV